MPAPDASPTLSTEFAPPERAIPGDLARDVAYFNDPDHTSALLDAVPDVFLILNEQRQTVFANTALQTLTGAPNRAAHYGQRPGEILGCVHAWENPCGCGTSRFCSTCGAAQAILSGLKGQSTTEECSISRPEGEALDLRVWSQPLMVDDRRYTTFAIQDITHEKRRRSLERIFFHDVLNTAGIIWTVVDLLQSDRSESSQLEQQLDAATRRLVDEIRSQQILLAAESGELELYYEPVSPRDLLAEIRDTSAYYAGQDDIRLVVEAAPDQALTTDQTLLRRVIANLVKNAIEASASGDLITMGWTTTSDTIVFSVHNPAYIPYRAQLQIFKRSFSTKGRGRGLGTYSTKLLVEQYLKGRVWFESDDTQGTTFKVSLPLDRGRA